MEIVDGDKGELPENLRPFIGLKVVGCWFLPSLMELVVHLEGPRPGMLTARLAERMAGDLAALFVKVGYRKPGVDWTFLDDLPRCDFLMGVAFSGLDRNILLFDEGRKGARFMRAGIELISRPG